MNQQFKLKSTGEICHEIEWQAKDSPTPWPNGYRRIMLPPQAPGHKNRIQIVHNTKLEPHGEKTSLKSR